MIYVENYHLSTRFFFHKAVLIWTDSEKEKPLLTQAGKIYLAEDGALHFESTAGTLSTPVKNAVCCGRILTAQSKNNHWVFELRWIKK